MKIELEKWAGYAFGAVVVALYLKNCYDHWLLFGIASFLVECVAPLVAAIVLYVIEQKHHLVSGLLTNECPAYQNAMLVFAISSVSAMAAVVLGNYDPFFLLLAAFVSIGTVPYTLIHTESRCAAIFANTLVFTVLAVKQTGYYDMAFTVLAMGLIMLLGFDMRHFTDHGKTIRAKIQSMIALVCAFNTILFLMIDDLHLRDCWDFWDNPEMLTPLQLQLILLVSGAYLIHKHRNVYRYLLIAGFTLLVTHTVVYWTGSSLNAPFFYGTGIENLFYTLLAAFFFQQDVEQLAGAVPGDQEGDDDA